MKGEKIYEEEAWNNKQFGERGRQRNLQGMKMKNS